MSIRREQTASNKTPTVAETECGDRDCGPRIHSASAYGKSTAGRLAFSSSAAATSVKLSHSAAADSERRPHMHQHGALKEDAPLLLLEIRRSLFRRAGPPTNIERITRVLHSRLDRLVRSDAPAPARLPFPAHPRIAQLRHARVPPPDAPAHASQERPDGSTKRAAAFPEIPNRPVAVAPAA